MAYSNIGAGARTGQRVTQPGFMSKQPLRKPGGGVLPSNMEQMPTFGPGASRGQMVSQPRNMEQMPSFNQSASQGQWAQQPQINEQMMHMFRQMQGKPGGGAPAPNMEQMPTFNQGAGRGQMVSQPWQSGTNLGGSQPGDQMMQMYGQMQRQPMQQPWQSRSNPNQMAAMQRLMQMWAQRRPQQQSFGTNLGAGTGGGTMRMY